jgi:uncharacterized phage protein (TIGR01671 family)
MSDRFKFRVWDKENKEYTTDSRIFLSPNGTVRYIEDSYWYDNVSEYYDVEFCTGLKDKNGKLIYEGDIVVQVYYNGLMGSKAIVKYGEFNCSCCDGVYGWYFDNGDIRLVEYYEVIGNIHENGDLLNED